MRSMKRILSLLLCLVLCLSLLPGAARAAETPIKVACVGDSITYGHNPASNTGEPHFTTDNWTTLLGNQLGSGYEVKNYGRSGTTVMKNGDMPYWNQYVYTQSKNYQPNIVILMLGTNDSKPANWAKKDQFLTDLKALIAEYQNLESKPEVYLATSATAYNNGAFDIVPATVNGEITALQKQAAQETGCKLIDINAATAGMAANFPDNIHPNAAGHKVIAEAMYQGLTASDDWTLAETFETDRTYVIVADGKYALTNQSAEYAGQTTLAAKPVTVEGGKLTCEITDDMCFTFQEVDAQIQAAADGEDQYFLFDAAGVQLIRGSGRSGTAPLVMGGYDAAANQQYGTWSLIPRTAEDGTYTLYLNSHRSYDYAYTLAGAEGGFNCPGASRSSWDAQTAGSSIRFYTQGNVSDGLDRADLRKAIREAEAVNRELYTDETLAALDKAVEAAKTALETAKTQDELNLAAQAVRDAILALEKKPVEPNKPVVIPDDGVQAANPYLPMWERIPDGEPRVFPDPTTGEDRLYVYGSHDTTGFYCGPDHVVWSAPLTDLTDWRYEGLAIKTTDLEGIPYVDQNGADQILHIQSGHLFYAPDVVYNPTTEKYTMIGFLSEANPRSFIFAATSDTPGGPFTDPHFIGWGFDPAVLVDDVKDENGHQRMYLYWSIEADRSGWAAELDPVTVTIKDGTTHSPRQNGAVAGQATMFSKEDEPFYFFEGPSIRKIGKTYVLSYARSKPLEGNSNGYLSEIGYATADNPFGDPALGSEWEYGGVIIDNKGELVADPYNPGATTYTYFGGNNHGGLIQAGDDWYQIYHRDTNKSSKRQSMAVKINLTTEDSKVKIDQAEFTSEGFHVEGLDPYQNLYAASFCYALPTTGGSWWRPAGPAINTNDALNFDPASKRDNWYGVTNLTNHTWLGYKYYNFGDGVLEGETLKLALTLKELAAGTVNVYAAPAKTAFTDPEQTKTLIGTITLDGTNGEAHTVSGEITNVEPLHGKVGIYLEFLSDGSSSVAELNMLVFEKTGTPVQPELDKTGLENAIQSAEALDLETYTPESAKNLEQALAAAKKALDEAKTQDELDQAAITLLTAIADL